MASPITRALCFAGKVGTGPGFTAEHLAGARRELDRIERQECPFDPPPAAELRRIAHWVDIPHHTAASRSPRRRDHDDYTHVLKRGPLGARGPLD